MLGASGTRADQISRFYWVDTLRGLAAISIVVFHYHHFYLADAFDRAALPPIESFPYSPIVSVLYSPAASKAVEVFWLISGFVFAHVYYRRRTGPLDFFLARFARLYPMHFATMLIVAAIQLISLKIAGHWQIYGNNDLKHFFLQLFLASNSTVLSEGLSFNGPIWSVSLEIAVYVMFFLSLPLLRYAPITMATIIASGAWLWVIFRPIDLPLIRTGVVQCAGYFYLGCLLYALKPHGSIRRWFCLMLAGATCAALGYYSASVDVMVCGSAVLLVAAFAGLDRFLPSQGKRLSGLGDISYAVYLVHVPIQMAALVVADVAFGGTRAFADSLVTLPAYVVVSIMAATAAHRWIETPAGRYIRSRLTAQRP